MLSRRLQILSIATLTTLSATVLVAPEADACSPAFPEQELLFPRDGDVVAPTAQVVFGFPDIGVWSPGTNPEMLYLVDESGELLSLTLTDAQTLAPAAPLPDGPYGLWVVDQEDEPEELLVSFTVSSDVQVHPLPEPQNLRWATETFPSGISTGDTSCDYEIRQYLTAAFDAAPIGEDTTFVQYRIGQVAQDAIEDPAAQRSFPSMFGSTHVLFQYADHDEIPAYSRTWGLEEVMEDCIVVWVRDGYGQLAGPFESCQPDQCLASPSSRFEEARTRDWDSTDASCDDYGATTNSGGCSSTGHAPSPAWLLLLAGLAIATRRRQGSRSQ